MSVRPFGFGGRAMTQTAPDGASRTFEFFRDAEGNPWMNIVVVERDGTKREEGCSFTNEQFADFKFATEI